MTEKKVFIVTKGRKIPLVETKIEAGSPAQYIKPKIYFDGRFILTPEQVEMLKEYKVKMGEPRALEDGNLEVGLHLCPECEPSNDK